ncbi:MAG: RNA polymerase sigma factor, partial [Bacteroidota bacterium]
MKPSEMQLEDRVKEAVAGNRKALEDVIEAIKGEAYNLSVRFFCHLPDAQDACQEILVKIVTNLSKFSYQSSFKTWVYRVATNHLLNAKRTVYEQLSFEEGAAHLKEGLTHTDYAGADSKLLEEEVKITCTTSMLVCLSRSLRLAYLLGEILEFDSGEASDILDIKAATFRKRLSLARQKIRDFMSNQCGLFNPKNPCRCKKQINYSIAVSWFDPKNLNFANEGLLRAKNEIEFFMDEVAIFHS